MRGVPLLLLLAACGGGFGTDSGAVSTGPGPWPVANVNTSVGSIPGGSIQMLELDRRVSPPTLHVATEQGAAALRVLPQ